MPKRVYFDIETYSEVDLKETGVYPYASHPSTEVLCLAYALDDDPTVYTWRPGMPEPTLLLQSIMQGAYAEAHNVAFDAAIWHEILHKRHGWLWPTYEAFADSMAAACIANLPANLDQAAKLFGNHEKNKAGTQLMRKMCKPARAIKASNDPKRLHTAENINGLIDYCKDDVKAERGFRRGIPDMSPFEVAVWRATWRMNRRGVNVDQPLVHRCIELAEQIQERQRAAMSRLTGGRADKETQRARLAEFLVEQGAVLPKSDKGNYVFGKKDWHAVNLEHASPVALQVLDLYKKLNKSSLSKFKKMLSCLCPDGRIRGMFMYSGAGQTGRWAGRDVQLQNLPRGVVEQLCDYQHLRETVLDGDLEELEFLFGDPMSALATLIRVALIPKKGRKFLVADYSAIEGRVLAWLAGEKTIIKAYEEGKRLYAVVAAAIYGCSYEQVMAEKAAGNSKKDKDGKVGDLACGYQGGVGAIDTMGGRDLPASLKRKIVTGWRDSHPMTVKLWRDIEKAATDAVRSPGLITTVRDGMLKWCVVRGTLLCRLPSGRKLYYRKARIGEKVWPDGGTSPQLEYYGVDSKTKAVGWIQTYGGSLTENVVQAIARDIMAAALVEADRQGYELCMTVHDELVAEEDKGGRTHEDLCALMCDSLPGWAKGLPIKAAGFTSDFYMK